MSFRILLVEDDEEIGEFVAQGLREEGYVVEQAVDGHSGSHALGTAVWDLVILDWWLPGPDGFTLLRQFRDPALLINQQRIDKWRPKPTQEEL